MPSQKRIVIIGGTACGAKTAARARRLDQSARITVIEQRDNLSTATCGLPYYISDVVKERNLVSRDTDYFRNVFDMTVLTGTRALSIDPRAHSVEITDIKTDKRSTLEYDKLVIATGATPTVPNWEGKDLRGIFTLNNIPDAMAIRNYIGGMKNKEAVIVGAGLIGVEAAENFSVMGLKVTVLEALGWPLPALLDYEMAAPVEKHLKAKGINLIFGQRVSGFRGDAAGQVKQVMVGDKGIDADLVLLSLGVRPNVTLARGAGLTIGSTGGLVVDEHLLTSDPDIYAGGDCAEVTNIITGKKFLAPMGSTANKHGRVIGTNITGGDDTFPGVPGTAVVKVFDFTAARTGLNEAQAREGGREIVTSLIPGSDHAGYYPGARDITVKLIAEKSGKILGGQVVGPGDASKRIDVLAAVISYGASVYDLANLDLAYAPPYNSAMDPLHNAANVIRNKLSNCARSFTMEEIRKKLENGDKFTLLDVRSPEEWEAGHIDAKQVKLLPLPELRKRIGELAKDEEIVTVCRTSIRAYQAQKILDGAGFANVKFMDGSMSVWPYQLKF
jgi:NADPH-dependent 2,4-dienoyl-CoA reductase/sulfur reductase-like enzyme/rhodanese-related sulfurtransferase